MTIFSIMQTLFLTGNLTSDYELFKGKDEKEFIVFTVAANDLADRESGTTFYTCRMRRSGVAEFLKKGKYVSVCGALKVSQKEKDGKTYTNLDVWVTSLDVPFMRQNA